MSSSIAFGWRIVDLNEKQNAGFKSAQSDLAAFLLRSIQNGTLLAYDDSLRMLKLLKKFW
jgi:hypothetical protein